MGFILRLVGCCSLPLMFITPVWAGYVVQKETRSAEGMSGRPTVEQQTEYYDPDAGKFAMAEMILRFDSGEMIMLNNHEQTYYRNTVSGFCSDIEAVVTEITSSPEYKQAEQMMKQMQAQYGTQAQPQQRPKPVLRRVGRTKVAGYSAEHFQVKVGPEIEHEVWLTTDRRLDELDWKKNAKLRQKAGKFQRQFKACMKKMSRMSPGAEEQDDPMEEQSAFELRRKDSFVEVVTLAIKRQSIPASRFEPPAGYRPVSMKEAMAMPERGGDDGGGAYGGAYSREAEEAESGRQPKGWAQQDAEDIGEHAERETHDQSKNAIEDEISDQVKKGLKGLRGLFGN